MNDEGRGLSTPCGNHAATGAPFEWTRGRGRRARGFLVSAGAGTAGTLRATGAFVVAGATATGFDGRAAAARFTAFVTFAAAFATTFFRDFAGAAAFFGVTFFLMARATLFTRAATLPVARRPADTAFFFPCTLAIGYFSRGS